MVPHTNTSMASPLLARGARAMSASFLRVATATMATDNSNGNGSGNGIGAKMAFEPPQEGDDEQLQPDTKRVKLAADGAASAADSSAIPQQSSTNPAASSASPAAAGTSMAMSYTYSEEDGVVVPNGTATTNTATAASSGSPLRTARHIQRFIEDQRLLSSQSIPTPSTPYTISTPTVADAHRKKILVTGGAGFVGSHLVDRLMGQGHEVIVLDNFFTGNKDNVAHWMHHPNFSLVRHDVTLPILLEVDQIYHLACPASPPHYQYNPVKTIKTSTMGTLNMLGLAKRVKARMLLASTSEIYGDPTVHPQPESYWGNVNTLGPRACYDEGKRVAETMMYAYKNQNDVEVRIARIFNTFGPRMHPNDGRVVSNFIIQALQNKDITIYGDGSQTRSFQYVSDLVEGLIKLMNGNYDGPVNLGNPDEYSIKDFAEQIKDMTKSESEVIYLPKVADDPTQRNPDISTAKRELGWSPQVHVKEGLGKAVEFFQNVLNQAGEIKPTGPEAAKPAGK